MRALPAVLLVGLVLVVVSTGLTVWWATRLLRRVCDRARRLTEQGSLSVKAHLAPGSRRQVAAARLQLRTGLEQTRRVLADGARRQCPLGDLPGIFRRLEHVAQAVDAELQILDGDRDRLQRARLAEVLGRADELVSMATGIRRTVGGVYAEIEGDGFQLLQRDLDVELTALRAGAAAVRQPSAIVGRR